MINKEQMTLGKIRQAYSKGRLSQNVIDAYIESDKFYLISDDLFEVRAINKAKEIIKWMKIHKRKPSSRAKDEKEKKFNNWIVRQKASKKGKIKRKFYPSVEKLFIDAGYPDMFKEIDLEQNALDKAKEIIKWMKIHKRKPSQHSKDEKEKMFGSFIRSQRQAKKGTNKVKFYPSVEKLFIDTGYPDMFKEIDLEQNALDKAKEIIKWMKIHKRKPINRRINRRNVDKNEPEKFFCTWIQEQKKAKRGKGTHKFYPSVEKLFIDAGYPDMFEIFDNEQNALNTAKEIIKWMKIHKRKPSHHSKDEKEKIFGRWIFSQKTAKTGTGKGKFYPSVEKLFTDAGYPDMFKEIDLEQNALDKAKEIIKWMNGRKTLATHTRKDEKEKKFAKFIYSQRQAKKGKGKGKFYPSVEKLFTDAGYPDILKTRDELN